MNNNTKNMTKVSRNASCPCGSGKKYKKCCITKDSSIVSNSASEVEGLTELIKEFKLSKSKSALVHPLFSEKTKYSGSLDVYIFTLGHLWIYKLIEEFGYTEFLREIIKLSLTEKNSLFEWELFDSLEAQLISILNKYDIKLHKYLNEEFDLFDHDKLIRLSKNKDHPYHRLTRLLLLGRTEMINQLFSLDSENIEELLTERGTIINATYLAASSFSNIEELKINPPNSFYDLIYKNMKCKTEKSNMRYYPKLLELSSVLSMLEKQVAENWYLVPDDDQVILSKLLYSLRLVNELQFSLYGLNGILSTFVTRALFDNYWQSMYLIKNNKISDYRSFALDRMRIHILKRSDKAAITSIDDLISEIEGGILDPIPINGDYFKKSPREYAIELGLKEEYDKFYEYNSEFIHTSLTAVYSGLMAKCKNPEHNDHLTIHEGGSRLIDSVPGIFDILNKHITLVNNYFEDEVINNICIDNLFFRDREDFLEWQSSINRANE